MPPCCVHHPRLPLDVPDLPCMFRMSPMPSHPLDTATELTGPADAPVRTGRTSDAYWTFIGPFGGVSAATALRAVLERPDRAGDPIAITVNFCAPIARGEFAVHTRRARANRSSQHWLVEFRQGESDEAVLTASIVTALRRDSWSHQTARAPALPAFETMAAIDNTGSLPWVAQYGFRFAEGALALSAELPPRPAARAPCCGSTTTSRARSMPCRWSR